MWSARSERERVSLAASQGVYNALRENSEPWIREVASKNDQLQFPQGSALSPPIDEWPFAEARTLAQGLKDPDGSIVARGSYMELSHRSYNRPASFAELRMNFYVLTGLSGEIMLVRDPSLGERTRPHAPKSLLDRFFAHTSLLRAELLTTDSAAERFLAEGCEQFKVMVALYLRMLRTDVNPFLVESWAE